MSALLQKDSRLLGLFREWRYRSQSGRVLRLPVELNQEVDCAAQASYAVADCELVEVLVVRDGNADVNFFCVWPARSSRTRRYFDVPYTR